LSIENLEPRTVMSASGSVLQFVSSQLADAAEPLTSTPSMNDGALPISQTPSPVAAGSSQQWDWLADTKWYVPAQDMLAYWAQPDLSDPLPMADQTVWHFQTSSGGHITGESVAKLSISSTPVVSPFNAVITESGQVRIEFIQGEGQATTGIGQFRFQDGQWRMQMQMGTSGSSTFITHWAYQSILGENDVPPDPVSPPPPGSLRSEEWRWIKGTLWSLSDTNLLGAGPGTGVFQVDDYHSGYFWGSGISNQPFNVLGSITPDGNVIFFSSASNGQPQSRAGGIVGGIMVLRSYEGDPAAGSARLLDDPSVGSSRAFMSSILQVTHL